MTNPEVEGLRNYLDAGGFLIVDDFWGQREWDVFEYNIRRVYPDYPIVDITLDHPIYSAYYDIEEVKQVPAIGRAMYPAECYGCAPHVKGIYDEAGRLVVIINFNTDLGDAWEWAEDPRYPLEYSTCGDRRRSYCRQLYDCSRKKHGGRAKCDGRTESSATCSHHCLPSPAITDPVNCGPATKFCWDPNRRFTKHDAQERDWRTKKLFH